MKLYHLINYGRFTLHALDNNACTAIGEFIKTLNDVEVEFASEHPQEFFANANETNAIPESRGEVILDSVKFESKVRTNFGLWSARFSCEMKISAEEFRGILSLDSQGCNLSHPLLAKGKNSFDEVTWLPSPSCENKSPREF